MTFTHVELPEVKWKAARSLRVLSFDIENRPLSYWVPDRPSAEITAIAAGWIDVKRVECWMLTRKDSDPGRILERFVAMYDQADIVTGHYVLGHDLPIINGALIELGMPLLKPKLVQDTRKHLIRSKDMPLSQEALAEYFGLTYGKEHMSQPAWRKANRLGEAGAPLTRARVVGDVQQHKALRLALLEKGYLRPPARWSP
jgi:hypothetical protein